MAALAEPTDLGTYLGITLEDDDARAILVLSLASADVLRLAGAGGQDWGVGNVPDDVLAVVLADASRRWENPAGANETRTGPFSKGWDVAAWITADERETVTAYNSGSVNGLSSIRVEAPWGASGSKSVDPYDGEHLLQ